MGSTVSNLCTPTLAKEMAKRPQNKKNSSSDVVVGVRECRTENLRFRMYYPSSSSSSSSSSPSSSSHPSGWFYESLGDTLMGYVHSMSSIRSNTLLFSLSSPFIRFFSNFLNPLSYAKPPGTFKDLGIVEEGHPLIVFSHGLTGVGEEHATLFAEWARIGYVVACVNHCDGSSSRAVTAKGEVKYYEHPPGMRGAPGIYPPDYRQQQILKREVELHEMLTSILDGSAASLPPGFNDKTINPQRVVVGGYSYGAATASLCASQRSHLFSGALLLDGWFSLDLESIKSCPSNDHIDFPPKAFERGIKELPVCFIGSEEFSNYSYLSSATERLHKICGENSEFHIIPGSVHWSFQDLVCWLGFLSQFFYNKLGNAVGVQHAKVGECYHSLFDISGAFLIKLLEEERERERVVGEEEER